MPVRLNSSSFPCLTPLQVRFGENRETLIATRNRTGDHDGSLYGRLTFVDVARTVTEWLRETWAKPGQRIGLEYRVLRPVARLSATESARLRINLSGT